MPAYYRKALTVTEALLTVYFLLHYLLFGWATKQWSMFPLLMFVGMIACVTTIGKINLRATLLAHATIVFLWCGWYTYVLGWSIGAQHFLMPVLALVFFNIYEMPWVKILSFFILIGYRMLLFHYSINHPPLFTLGDAESIALQTINSVMVFVNLASLFILFSSSIQDAERQLTIDNQALHREAGTDPLTQLPNRRAMLNAIHVFQVENPEVGFSIAIADIDFFKNINDTYGHNCGDYTLKQLADTFQEHAAGIYQVCRWGGEEFCFFLPGKNLDEAGQEMHELNLAVRRMPLSFEGNDFSITITIGVEEFDFYSTLDAVLEKADQKLYMGKVGGRDRVVF